MAAAEQVVSNPIPAMTISQPLEKPVVVIGPQFLVQYPLDLTITSKALSLGKNDFKITDVNGTLILKFKSKLFGIHDHRFLKDAADNTLVTLRQKLMAMHDRWEVFRGESTDDKDLLSEPKGRRSYNVRLSYIYSWLVTQQKMSLISRLKGAIRRDHALYILEIPTP